VIKLIKPKLQLYFEKNYEMQLQKEIANISKRVNDYTQESERLTNTANRYKNEATEAQNKLVPIKAQIEDKQKIVESSKECIKNILALPFVSKVYTKSRNVPAANYYESKLFIKTKDLTMAYTDDHNKKKKVNLGPFKFTINQQVTSCSDIIKCIRLKGTVTRNKLSHPYVRSSGSICFGSSDMEFEILDRIKENKLDLALVYVWEMLKEIPLDASPWITPTNFVHRLKEKEAKR
jgi:hypothetical protein